MAVEFSDGRANNRYISLQSNRHWTSNLSKTTKRSSHSQGRGDKNAKSQDQCFRDKLFAPKPQAAMSSFDPSAMVAVSS